MEPKKIYSHKKQTDVKKKYSILKCGALLIVSGLVLSLFMTNSCINSNNETARYKYGKNMKPSLFDVRANDLPTKGVPVVKPWKYIKLDPEYAGAWVVAGDVDEDGEVEIISARNVNENDNHYTCSVVVQKLDGKVLWRWGNPEIGRYSLHHDVACQVYDWDGDGKKEVIVAAKERLVELDGLTGKEKRSFAIPTNASDCLVFVNLTGGKRATDILVKTRYSQIWAYNQAGELLWTIEKPAGYKTAHQPYPVDIDGDGKDEIMAGYAMLNADGSIRWDLKDKNLSMNRGHMDCARILNFGKTSSTTDLVMTLCGDTCIARFNGDGELNWCLNGFHFESIDVGKIYDDIPGKQIVVDVDHTPHGESPVWVIDENGNFLGRIVTDYSRRHLLIDWFGNGTESIAIGTPACLFDGQGNKTVIFDTKGTNCFKADMTGDSVPDIFFVGDQDVTIFKNEKGKKSNKYSTLGTDVNFTLY